MEGIDAEALAAMNEAAREAEAALRHLIQEKDGVDTVPLGELLLWWVKWYLSAGHKRLGRILVKISKEGS